MNRENEEITAGDLGLYVEGDVIIEMLPTIGSAMSIKTNKQGRQKQTVREAFQERPYRGSSGRSLPVSVVTANAKRIAEFNKASAAQRRVAQEFIDSQKIGLIKTIQGITRTLSRLHRDF